MVLFQIQTEPAEPFDDTQEKHLLYFLDAGQIEISWEEINAEAEVDLELVKVREAIISGLWEPGFRRFECQAKHLRVLGPLVFKDCKIVLPTRLRRRALQSAHQGHMGAASVKRILREYFWWPGLAKEAEVYVEQCETCFLLSRKNPPIPLTSRALPQGPWEILQIDFYTDYEFGYGEFLVVVDTYSRYLHVVEMKTMDAEATNMALNRIFEIWGYPLAIQSDNGPPFQSEKFIKTWENKGVKIWKSIPLSAQSNGAVERQNKGIKDALAAARIEKVNWRVALDKYVHMHNKVRPLSRLGVSPFELLVGWKFRGTFPHLWEKRGVLDRTDIREKDAESKLESKQYADEKRGAKASNIVVGDTVVICRPKRLKSDPIFGPEKYTVVARDGAKIVVRSERGVQISRNVQEAKKVPEIDKASSETTEGSPNAVLADCNEQESTIQEQVAPVEDTPPRKSTRELKKPSKFKDMLLYTIFE